MARINHSVRSALLARTLFVGALGLGILLGGCQSKILQHGNVPDEDQVVQIQPGQDDKNRVEQLLGSPSTTGTFGDDVWYYVSKRTSQTAFFEPDIIDQGVLAISFDNQGIVQDMKVYDQTDGRLVAMVDRVTPTHGNELTIIQQMLGNLGRFSPGEDGPKTGPTGTTGAPGGV
ncbi:outer membrane protein assembly factor BamE [Dongia sp.]|jgi:outer membrane protein assembly factor BamE (lipoprotein component of BamABCDE complex)|uniref:outer membrane protein assembly factor BamE n=1 Tax=Dongia sp. TaxID=1977262 RepID=UPI0035B3E77C